MSYKNSSLYSIQHVLVINGREIYFCTFFYDFIEKQFQNVVYYFLGNFLTQFCYDDLQKNSFPLIDIFYLENGLFRNGMKI